MKKKRLIVHIDESRCDGCGLCLPNCAEHALYLENGKVKLRQDKLCDGLGACLGICPKDALRLEERDAEDFDHEAVQALQSSHTSSLQSPPATQAFPTIQACHVATDILPGAAKTLQDGRCHWPVKFSLTSPESPALKGSKLLLCADCAPAVCPAYHKRYLPGTLPLLLCPKLEPKEALVERLTQIFKLSPPASMEILRMEVPCCCIPELVQKALERVGLEANSVPTSHVTVLSRQGQEPLMPLRRPQ